MLAKLVAGLAADLMVELSVELVLLLAKLMVVHAASAVELIDVVLAVQMNFAVQAAVQAVPAVMFVHAVLVVISRFLRSGHLKSRICVFLRGPIGATSFECHRYNP